MTDFLDCPCPLCRTAPTPEIRAHHRRLRLLQDRLDEAQRRWAAAVEARRLGRGGIHLVAQITGLDAKTIRRGCTELADELRMCPPTRIRRPGAGRPLAEKNARMSKTA